MHAPHVFGGAPTEGWNYRIVQKVRRKPRGTTPVYLSPCTGCRAMPPFARAISR